MNYRTILALICLSLPFELLAAPRLWVTPSQPTAGKLFQISVSDSAYPNGCAPREIFSARLKFGNRIEMVALPTGEICTQAITSYQLSTWTKLEEPGVYTLEYSLGFNQRPVASLTFTVRPDDSVDASDSSAYKQGFEEGKLACLKEPAVCGIDTEPVTYRNGELHIPVVQVIGPFNEITRYSADLVLDPFSNQYLFELKAAEPLDEEE